MYLTGSEDFEFPRDQPWLLWNEQLEYGNWVDGPLGDGTRQKAVNVLVPEVCLLCVGRNIHGVRMPWG